MKRRNITKQVIVLIIVFVLGMFYGIVIHKYHVFPYETISRARHILRRDKEVHSSWSIGIYKGHSPFTIKDPENISNPVLTAEDVRDADAEFVADPFIVKKGNKHFMFFEVFNKTSNQGDIAYAESEDTCKTWNYKKLVIDEEFHLSYPYVFEWDNSYYLVPESFEDFSVRLYKAIDFPEKWEYVGNMLTGYSYVDNSIFRYDDKWWMFVSTTENNTLNLYYSEDLLLGWKPHPMNPIVKNDRNISRPAGRVLLYENKLYRFAQDDEPDYGTQVFVFEIGQLSQSTYQEKLVSMDPVIKFSGNGWNAGGMHHVDLHKIGNEWVGAVDGRGKW